MNDFSLITLIFITSFVFGLIIVSGLKYFAIRKGWLVKSRSDRWRKGWDVAKYGGVGIFVNFLIFTLIFSAMDFKFIILLIYCLSLFLLGLIDDKYDLKPYVKFFIQICSSTLYIAVVGSIFPLFSNEIANYLLSLLWLVGITNAFNLLDNMDGLAGGMAIISSLFYIILLLLNNRLNEVIPLVVFFGSVLGFLYFNFYPAKIFMGDCGSYFLGSFLATYVTYVNAGYTGGLFAILFIPVFILFLPILDTTLVTFGRLIQGKPIFEGGIDHASHRLVFLGLTEKRAVVFLYIFAALSGLVAVVIRYYAYPFSFIAIPSFMIFAGIAGAYLLNAIPEEKRRNSNGQTVATVILEFTYKQRIIEIILDVALIVISLLMGYVLRFEQLNDELMELLFDAMPILIIIQLICNYIFGIYESVWRYASIRDLLQYLKASFAAAAASMLVLLYLYRFSGHSRSVYALYAIIYFILLSASRASFKVFHSILIGQTKRGKNAMLFGAGDAGELAIREIYNNPSINLNPIGFIDDDPLKKERKIHGLRVVGNGSELEKIIKKYNIETMILTTKKIDADYMERIFKICKENGCEIMEVEFEFKLKLGNSIKDIKDVK